MLNEEIEKKFSLPIAEIDKRKSEK